MILFAALLFAATATTAPDLSLEVQRTGAEHRRGLQGHAPLLEHQGMLFVFQSPKRAEFWMKDVTFPIDIVFLDAKRRVLNVAADVPPCPSTPCPIYESDGEASFVLELPAGWAARFGVVPGTAFNFDIPNRKAELVPRREAVN